MLSVVERLSQVIVEAMPLDNGFGGCSVSHCLLNKDVKQASVDKETELELIQDCTPLLKAAAIAQLWCLIGLQTVVLGRACCPLSRVEPLLGGSKCTICMAGSIGGMGFVRCTEVVR